MKHIIDDAFISMLESHELHIQHPMDGLFGGNRRSSAYGNSPEFADFREYVPGDDLRRIDWHLYARFEKLFLKLFIDERQLHHRIYIDTSASMDWGKPQKSDVALRLAAALGFLSVQAMDRVTYYTVNGTYCKPLTATVVGREAFYAAANMLNGIEFHGDNDIGAAVCAQESPGHEDGLSVIISDFLTDSDWKSAVDYLLFHKRDVCLIQVLSRDEISPDLSGKLLMMDSEADNEEDSRHYREDVTRFSIEAYERAFEYHQNDIRRFCAARNVGFFSVCSDDDIERMLFLQATEVGLIR